MADLYTGDLQNEREINAAQIKDQLYIFTGTYPLYYKGDGKLYLLPEHQPTFVEQLVSGHNTIMDDFETYYYESVDDKILDTVSNTNTENRFVVEDLKFSPLLPFENIRGKMSFTIPEEYFNDTDNLYSLNLKVYSRPSLPGTTSEDYAEFTDFFLDTIYYWGDTSFAPAEGEVLTTLNIANAQISFEIFNLELGLRDFKFELEIKKQADIIRTTFEELLEITVSAAKIEDYPTEENPERGGFRLKAPWTANQVMEHYGQLLIWGSESMPKTLFISSNENLSYFPDNYTLTFENDLNEKLNSVVPYMNILVVQSDSYTWGLKGSNPIQFLDRFAEEPNPNAYQVFSINKSVGSIAPKSVRPVRNRLYFLSQEGLMELTSLFATDDRYNVKPLDRNIRNLVPQDREAVAIQFDNQYWVNFPSTGEVFRYYVDKQAWVRDTFNFHEFNGIYKFRNEDGKLKIITHPMVRSDENFNYEIKKIEVDYSLSTDLQLPITTKFLTSRLNQNYPFHPKRYKELKLDFSIQNEYMPNRAPLELTGKSHSISFGNNLVGFTADLQPNHAYTVAFDSFNVSLAEGDQFQVNNLPSENLSVKNGMLRFVLTNEPVSEINILFKNNGEVVSQLENFTVVDDTYDAGILYDLRVMADNNTMIRDDFKSYAPIEKTIDTGSEFSNITFGNTNFGDVTTFVQTTKLKGSGYDINVYYKDDSNIKWTLESMGITYKMRRTRSDRNRGG